MGVLARALHCAALVVESGVLSRNTAASVCSGVSSVRSVFLLGNVSDSCVHSGLLKLLALVWHGLLTVFPILDAHLEPWFLPPETSIFPQWPTHGVIPVPCHSHNDYWRRVPLLSALEAGCISVEADVWLSGEELLVGHSPHTLVPNQTLRGLYLEPLMQILSRHNARPNNLAVSTGNDDIAGVFATDPAQTFVLLVHFKNNDEQTWPLLVKQLEPLRQNGLLTHVNGSDLIQRPLTVVMTGDAPFHRITENGSSRDIFYDAPLDELSTAQDLADGAPPPRAKHIDHAIPYTSLNSYYASADFRQVIGTVAFNHFSQGQLLRLRQQVKAAHDLALKVRYWGTPNWPRGLRNKVWHILVREGVDVMSTDDLKDATSQDWRKHRS